MYGFFKNKRIVLYDTLIQQVLRLSVLQANYSHIQTLVLKYNIIFSNVQCQNENEIVAVIAHELGHWKLNHTTYSFIAVQVRNDCPELIYSLSSFSVLCLHVFTADSCLLAIWRIHSCQKLHWSLQEFWFWYTTSSHWFDHISGLFFFWFWTQKENSIPILYIFSCLILTAHCNTTSTPSKLWPQPC